ncbi:hypothetical protein SAMN05216535_2055 [Stutzerimonas xanthomarina]|uniref:Cytochrome c domain-containing protein n=2 Tax=Stutzerimonas xanthomarina TaxID=271420 RepID=A0A1M5NAL1_9GAMM|nr:hypothetical protein SAMN05216535_2055 [Stutzerimonas xanthomarina]SHG86550.1 hypothetical protein SAMN02744645_1761 [Stutzerimonas xanthomarina DSM 18231]
MSMPLTTPTNRRLINYPKSSEHLAERLSGRDCIDRFVKFAAGAVRCVYRRVQHRCFSGSFTLRSLGVLDHDAKLSIGPGGGCRGASSIFRGASSHRCRALQGDVRALPHRSRRGKSPVGTGAATATAAPGRGGRALAAERGVLARQAWRSHVDHAGFGETHKDAELWDIAAFVKQLPGMTASEYAALGQQTGTH